MRDLVTVFKRETSAYFNSAIAYIFIIVFVLLNGSLFMTQFFIYNRADMRPFYMNLPLILAVFLPAVTMRLWAEERRGNTLELLLTFPITPIQLVLGKFFASLSFYLTALAGTLIIPVMLSFLGKPDLGAIASAYVGAVFLGAFFLAIGIFISGLARDQIVAFILAMMICFTLFLIGTDFFATALDGWLPGLGTLLSQFLGTPRHFDSFAKGVIDSRDVFYFVIGTIIFLVLNGFWIEGRMRPKAKAIFTSAVVICVGIFLTSNWLMAGVPLGRFDLTQGQIFTIGPATKKILTTLKAPVTAKLYVSPSEKMPTSMKMLEQDIKGKLDEFRIASNGKFQYKIFHMEAANVTGDGEGAEESLEQQLSDKGVKPFQVQSIEADEVGVRLIYSAISLAYKEKPEQIIPRIAPDNIYELEYLLISKIFRMNLDTVPKVALVAPYFEKEVEPEVQALLAQLGGEKPEAYREDMYELLPMALQYEGYDVSRIKLTEKEPIPEGTKTLMVVEPQDLSERQRYEINRFVRSGGALFMAVQNYKYQYSASERNLQIVTEAVNPNVNALLTSWGFTVDEQILVDEQNDVVNLSGAARLGPFEVSIPIKIPIQIVVNQSGMNPNVSIASRLSSLFYLWGTTIKIDTEKVKTQGLKVTPLLYSSQESWTVPFKSGNLTPDDLQPNESGDHKAPFTLAILAEGQFADAFEGKTVPAWAVSGTTDAETKSVETSTPSPLTPAPGKMILMGASTMLQKTLLRNGGHLNYFLNSIDAITLGEDLISIRSKLPIDRSIGRLPNSTKILWRFVATLLVPIVIAIIGAFRVLVRKQSKENYLNALATASE